MIEIENKNRKQKKETDQRKRRQSGKEGAGKETKQVEENGMVGGGSVKEGH